MFVACTGVCNAQERFQSKEFKDLDTNRDAALSLKEFVVGKTADERKRQTRDFRVLDFDANDLLSAAEFSLTLGLPPGSDRRGPVPDPFVSESDRAVSKWRALFKLADRNRNGALSRAEWPAAELKSTFGILGNEEFPVWDRDRNSEVALDEGIWFFEVAYGLRGLDGKLLRTPTGFVIDRSHYQILDVNHDGAVSRTEFVSHHPGGQDDNETLFKRIDANQDGTASFDEISVDPEFAWDIVERFLDLDLDLDGMLSEPEITTGARRWQLPMASRLIGAFDVDRDHKLSFQEYRATPFANFGTDWYRRRRDADSDGRLSFKEFYREESPFLIAQSLHFFKHFDRSGDGFVSLAELDFDVDWLKVPKKLAISSLDRNGNGELTLDELFNERSPAESDVEASRTYQQRSQIYAEWFRSADKDGNGLLTAAEFSDASSGFSPSAFARFVELDPDGDGSVSLNEFLAMAAESKKRDAARIFHVIDTNGDGRLTCGEFAQIPDFSRPDARGVVSDPVVDWMERQLVKLLEVFRAQDGDGDGRVPVRGWTSEKWEPVVPYLAGASPSVWDRDHDGNLTAGECRFVLEVAYGIRRADGQPLRDHKGLVLNLPYLRSLDKNGDDILSKEEFVSGYWAGPERSAKIFIQLDANGDGRATYAEIWASATFSRDIVKMFLEFDTDFDGYVNDRELLAGVTKLQQPLALRIMRGWDTNGDGRLSLYEFRATPVANPLADWHSLRKDENGDGKLSWNESYKETFPFLAGLNREFFQRFDVNHDKFLTYDELEFRIDPNKVPAEIAFGIKDKDADGKLVFSEVFAESPPPAADLAGVEKYQRRLAHAETKFLAADANHDGALDLKEYADSRHPVAAGADTTALLKGGTSGGRSGIMVGLSIFHAVLLIGVGWMFLRRRAAR